MSNQHVLHNHTQRQNHFLMCPMHGTIFCFVFLRWFYLQQTYNVTSFEIYPSEVSSCLLPEALLTYKWKGAALFKLKLPAKFCFMSCHVRFCRWCQNLTKVRQYHLGDTHTSFGRGSDQAVSCSGIQLHCFVLFFLGVTNNTFSTLNNNMVNNGKSYKRFTWVTINEQILTLAVL